MKGIILAAGIGSRLRPLTEEKPKCLVEVEGKCILEYQIESYVEAGIEEIIIVTGYYGEKIRNFIEEKKYVASIKLINNIKYAETNNMYSLYMAKEMIGNGFIMSNADVILQKDMIKELMKSNIENAIATDIGKYNDESMKISVSEKGIIKKISKQITENEAFGVSIDVYKFGESATKKMINTITQKIEIENDVNSWTEVALDSILAEVKFYPFDIKNKYWYEIDNFEDLEKAREIVREYELING